MGNTIIKPLAQPNTTLQKLFDCFRNNEPINASDIVILIEKKVMAFDANAHFVGTINIHWFDNLYEKLKALTNINIDKFCQNKSDTYINYDINGVKPYLLAYVFSVINNQWYNVFKRLFHISHFNVNDTIFGLNFFELFLIGKNIPANFGHDYYDKEISRKLLKDVEISKIKCKIFDDPIWYLIKDNNPEILKDIFEVSNYKSALKQNYLYKINEISNRMHFIDIFLKYTDSVFDPVHQEYCFMQAIKCHQVDYVNDYLSKMNVIEKFQGNCILHYMFEHDFYDVGVIKRVIEIANYMYLDIVNLHNGDGKTPLWIICEKLTHKHYECQKYDPIVKLLIENGADLYHELDGVRLIDIVIGKNMYMLARKMVEWCDDYNKLNNDVGRDRDA